MEPKKSKYFSEQIEAFFKNVYFGLLPRKMKETSQSKFREKVFEKIKNERRWGESNISGGGSSIEFTKSAREIILHVINDFNIKSLLDVACGDFIWMPIVLKALKNDFKYIGCDIVSSLIKQHKTSYPEYEFRTLDFVNDQLPQCDLIICRDALQHLPIKDIQKSLKQFSNSGAKYLLATTHLRYPQWKNKRDIRVGQCRDRNLILEPFNLDDPIIIYNERNIGNKFLGLWKLPLDYRKEV